MDIGANLGQQRLAGARARHRHRWEGLVTGDDGGPFLVQFGCACGVVRDPEKSRRGTSSRRLGHDQERRIERVYGPRKVGEFGDAIDLIGRDFMWQSKATRAPAPRISDEVLPFAARAYVARPMAAMLALRTDRLPLLVRSWVQNGKPTVDLIIVEWEAWVNLHGGPLDDGSGYVSMPGALFLDIHGRDEP